MNTKLFLCCLAAGVLFSGCATSEYAKMESMPTDPNQSMLYSSQMGYDFDAMELHPDYLSPGRSLKPIADDLSDLW